MAELVNIEFDSLCYSVKGFFDTTPKQILKEISGEFRACELTAIVGPSGSGKSTLLNILTGFTTQNVRGSIRVNGEKRNEEKFRKRSTFIMQEENLYGLLTLRETMIFAVRLKMGMAGNKDEKIMTILETLGLEMKVDSFVKNLSGGQQKRLAIAMELVNDPSILFLDEPTTGLDSSSTTQCIKLLKKLAQGGRTIICTIHQPSALIFEMFDHLYALVDGSCIYQGTSRNLVPFLVESDLICPESYNPADYLLEIATDGYGEQNHRLIQKIENGKNENYREPSKPMSICDVTAVNEGFCNKNSSSFAQQVYQLTRRNMLFNMRDKSFMIVRFAVHGYIGVLVGMMYYKIGNHAEQMINIYKSFLVLVVVLLYTSIYSLLVRFPLELPIIRREYFNRWYSMGAHYVALVLADVPIVFISSLLFTIIACVMMDHPLDSFRIIPLLAIGVMMSFTAQAYGIFAGSFVEIKLTVLFAALLMLYQILFAGGLVFMKDVNKLWHPFFEISFVKHALDGYTTLLLGFNRTKLSCQSMYCYFEAPKKFLDIIGMDAYIPKVFYSLAIIFVSFHFLAYCIMRYRVSNQSFFDKIKI